MAFSTAEGTRFFFSSTFGPAQSITGISNANPAVATAPSNIFANNDEIFYSGGWEDINESVFKVAGAAAGTFQLAGLDTTSTSLYPTGSGAGQARKINNWLEIPQVLTTSPEGGGTKYTEVKLLARRQGSKIPTGFEPASYSMQLAWDSELPNYKAMQALSRTSALVALKLLLSNNATIYGYGYLSVADIPELQNDSVNQVKAAFSFNGRITSYPAV